MNCSPFLVSISGSLSKSSLELNLICRKYNAFTRPGFFALQLPEDVPEPFLRMLNPKMLGLMFPDQKKISSWSPGRFVGVPFSFSVVENPLNDGKFHPWNLVHEEMWLFGWKYTDLVTYLLMVPTRNLAFTS